MGWKGYKAFIEDEFRDIYVSQTIDMTKDWKLENNPDKRLVETNCPFCDKLNHPLMQSYTVELSREKAETRKNRFKKKDNIIYGANCGKCNQKYKFKLICNSWLYPKLGLY